MSEQKSGFDDGKTDVDASECGLWAAGCSLLLSTAYVCSLYMWACPLSR